MTRLSGLLRVDLRRGHSLEGRAGDAAHLHGHPDGRRPQPGAKLHVGDPACPEDRLKARRDVYLPSERAVGEISIYDGARFSVGTAVIGPAIVDEAYTTIYIPPGVDARRDEHLNYRLSRGGAS